MCWTRTDAVGKHLLHHYLDGPILHVHLGLYGKFVTGVGVPPEPRGALRLRLVGGGYWSDLRGPTACEIFTPADVDALFDRLGPDPLRPRADPLRAFARLTRSRTSVAALLMDQSVIAGIGNVYRAELLFRHRVDPFLPGRSLPLAGLVGDVGRPGDADAGRGALGPDRDGADRGPGSSQRPDRPVGVELRVSAGRTAVPGMRDRRSGPRCWSGATCSGVRTVRRLGRPGL